jgi:hypothetical protein
MVHVTCQASDPAGLYKIHSIEKKYDYSLCPDFSGKNGF